MDSFYITLPSNCPNNHFDNTVANFKTELAQTLELTDDWEVGLAGISYTHSWYNLVKDEKIEAIYYENGVQRKSFVLPKGKYSDIQDLLKIMEYQFEKFHRLYFDGQLRFSTKDDKKTRKKIFNLNTYENKVMIILPKLGITSVHFEFSDDLCRILGFNKRFLMHRSLKAMELYKSLTNELAKPDEFVTLHADEPYNLDHIFYGIYVYSDIIRPTFVGNTMSQLLRFVEIPTRSQHGDQIVLSYPDTHYMPLLLKNIRSIEIHMMDEFGESFPFESGRAIITLHFRKKQ